MPVVHATSGLPVRATAPYRADQAFLCIEGATFTVDEAENTCFRGQIVESRAADFNTGPGTLNVAALAPWPEQPPRRGRYPHISPRRISSNGPVSGGSHSVKPMRCRHGIDFGADHERL